MSAFEDVVNISIQQPEDVPFCRGKKAPRCSSLARGPEVELAALQHPDQRIERHKGQGADAVQERERGGGSICQHNRIRSKCETCKADKDESMPPGLEEL